MEKKKNNKKKIDTRQSFDIKKQMKKVKTGIQNNVFIFTEVLPLSEFATKLNKPASEIIKYFFMKGKMHSLNTVLTEEEMGEICLEYNYDFEKKVQIDESNILDNLEDEDDEKFKEKRPPIITIMGHVDHGKTTLLDTIRKSKITSSEFGGITQHIGAYQITKNNELITFIDTPGHEAFTAMRARGANITDIVVLVVAADDGIMPQTEEAIDHAKAAKAPIIVFINKMDKPTANPQNIMSQLSEKGLTPEEWGGDTIVVKGSALKNEGIDELLQAILTLAEMLELKANPNRLGNGTTLEANLDKGFGPAATILVQNGVVKKFDFIVIGEVFGRIRTMFNDFGKEVLQATPGQPVKIIGLSEVPFPGTKWVILKDENFAKELSKKIKDKKINLGRAKTANVSSNDQDKNTKHLNLIIKCDVQGSLEAIKGMIEKIDIPGAVMSVVRASIGGITETDIQLAKATNAEIIGFNIKPTKNIKDLISENNIKIYYYNVIYKLKEDLVAMLKGTLDPIIEEQDIGEAEVRQIWKHSKIGTIIGLMVTSGKINRNANVKVVRDSKVIYDSTISSMQHGKDPINEISAGKECGIVIANFSDVKVGDILQVYKKVEKTFDQVNTKDEK